MNQEQKHYRRVQCIWSNKGLLWIGLGCCCIVGNSTTREALADRCISLLCVLYRDRPAAIPIHVKSIADTSNFEEFPEIEEKHSFENEGSGEKDWVFQNYTFKRFEGLTQRGLLRMSNQ